MTVLCFSVKEENCVLYETYQNSQHIDFFGHSNFLVVEKVTVTISGTYFAKSDSAKPESAVEESAKLYFAKPGNC